MFFSKAKEDQEQDVMSHLNEEGGRPEEEMVSNGS